MATSLDGYIAGPNGEFDWIVMDPSIDFAAAMAELDAYVMGRKTFEVAQQQPPDTGDEYRCLFAHAARKCLSRGKDLSSGAAEAVKQLKTKPGKDICLFGGGILFRSLPDAGLVDTIELSVVRIMLSQGIPLIARGERSCSALDEQQAVAHWHSSTEVRLMKVNVSQLAE